MGTTKVICFANNKGGSGKTTSCANVGYSLTLLGKRVLLVDGDMQMNLSLSFFSEEEVLEMASSAGNLYYAVKNGKSLDSYIVPTRYENLDVVPSSALMSGMEYELFKRQNRERILAGCLRSVKESGDYDYILLDAPPTLGCWTTNLLTASDYLLIPVEASPWGLFGLANMFEYFEEVQRDVPGLSLLGVAITKVDMRKNYFKQTMETLEGLSGVRVFGSYVRIDSLVEWSQDNSVPVMEYRKNSRSAKEYMELAKEVEAVWQ